MALSKKNLRYFYWFTVEYLKKHLRLILISSIISLVLIVSLLTFWPYFYQILTPVKKEMIGMVGNFNEDNIPDEILAKISSGILFVNGQGEFIPALASSWEIKDNGQQYRIQLKKDLFWNNGDNFTAKEINFKFKDVQIETDGRYLLKFILKKPLAVFPNYLTKPIIKSPLVGVAGLYKVERIKQENELIHEIYLTPNKARLPVIVYRFYDNEAKMINAYKLGEINQMTVYKKTIADTFTSWKNTEIIQGVDYSRLLTIFLNLKNPIFKEKDVRQAMAMAVDRKKIEDLGSEAIGPIPPVSWAYNPNLKKNTFDLELAEQLIKKNLTATDSAKLTMSTFYEYIDVASMIKEMFNHIGLSTSVNIVSNINPNNFDVLLAFWNVPSDPDQYYYWHSTQNEGNITSYKNLKVDKYLEDGRSTAAIEDRKKIYYEFQKVIIDDNPAIFIYYPYIYTIKRK